MTASNIKAIIPCDLSTVWNTVTDAAQYPAWRSDIGKTEIRSDQQFIEYTKGGDATVFTVTVAEPYRRWEFDMENSRMKGHWSGIFASCEQGTEIDFTEYVTAKKLFLKPFVKGYLKRQQAQFVSDLTQYVQQKTAKGE